MTIQLQRKQELHRLHQSGCFVIPNPWDLGGARVLAQLGVDNDLMKKWAP